ncbi:MAG: hypothetical protein LPK45_03050, partial [Bacteroidota bacterium]|nr:hypothetical protein [Bacteroidota bacterium]MDX5430021.1 hypothetical protein [Bacteroidota bacterium]MDX5468791.1 hypothetical protein [Bacteroidota bacterium]
MDTNWLLERLQQPALVTKSDVQDLREWIAKYPYFPSPYLLLARSLKEANHPAFDELLPFISLQAYDRRKLFRLVHGEYDLPAQTSTSEAPKLEVAEEIEEAIIEEKEAKADSGPRFLVDFSEVETASETIDEAPSFEETGDVKEIPFLMDVEEEPFDSAGLAQDDK